MVLEKTPENPLGSKEIKPINLKGNQPWILVGRTDTEAKAPVFWSSDANSRLIGKVPDAGNDWGQEKRVLEDEMPGWHHQCNGHELGKTLGDGEGQGGLVCWRVWGHRESDTTRWLNDKNILYFIYSLISWWTFGLSSLFGHHELRCYEHLYISICVNIYFCFSWACIREWNGLLIW